MKRLILCTVMVCLTLYTNAQNTDKEAVERVCKDYIEGFYEGDQAKLKRSLSPDMLKFGYWKDRNSGEYKSEGQMTFQEALNYAKGVKEKQNFPKADAPRGIEVYDVSDHIAAAKVTAWWGFDYILLSKKGGKWMIEQVLWQGPLKKEKGGR
jgi:hypothetical protein